MNKACICADSPAQRGGERWSSGSSLAMQSEGCGFESDPSHSQCLIAYLSVRKGKGKQLPSSDSLMAKANWTCRGAMDVTPLTITEDLHVEK